jgi:lipoprotein NlpD
MTLFGPRYRQAAGCYASRYIGPLMTILLLPACASTVGYQPASAPEGSVYTVRAGESLYSIAWRYGLDYKAVAGWNDIEAPYTIYPGQDIRLNPPAALSRAPTASPSPTPAPGIPAPAPPPPETVPLPPPVQTTRTTPVAPQPSIATPSAAPAISSKGWQWPAQGVVIRSFSPDANGKKGIDISGEPGQPIVAASSGKVVYSGGGLVGYGQLIIIKHGGDFLSAYAHNRKLLVKEGEQVTGGQMIAELGSTGVSRPMLHFEIREAGQPVDPLHYLPER